MIKEEKGLKTQWRKKRSRNTLKKEKGFVNMVKEKGVSNHNEEREGLETQWGKKKSWNSVKKEQV